MSNHGVLCQTNVSLYLQFLNCASKNCLFLILFSLCLSLRLLLHPAVSVKSAFILPHHFSIKNASSQGSAPQNIVLSWRAYHWMLKLPQVASLVFQWSALQFSRKKEEKPTRTHRLQQYFKRRVALCVTCHGKKKKRKNPNHPRNSKQNQQNRLYMIFKGNHLQVWPNQNRIMVILRPWWRQSITKETRFIQKNQTHGCCYIWGTKIQTKIVEYLAELSSG